MKASINRPASNDNRSRDDIAIGGRLCTRRCLNLKLARCSRMPRAITTSPKLLVYSFSSGRAYKQGVTRLLWLWLLDLQVKADGQERGLSLSQAVTPELFPRYHHSERTVSHLAECQQFPSSNKVLMATGQDSVDLI